MLKLYFAANTCALASHIALREAGAGFETVRLDFRTDDQRKPEYLSINPKGRVPALVTDHGVLTQTPAILAFIAQSFPHARLAPPSTIRLPLPAFSPSTAIFAPQSTLRMPTGCAATDGQTIRPQSPR
jgi:hypothetical protein